MHYNTRKPRGNARRKFFKPLVPYYAYGAQTVYNNTVHQPKHCHNTDNARFHRSFKIIVIHIKSFCILAVKQGRKPVIHSHGAAEMPETHTESREETQYPRTRQPTHQSSAAQARFNIFGA